jgi:hypothetical protein
VQEGGSRALGKKPAEVSAFTEHIHVRAAPISRLFSPISSPFHLLVVTA